MEFKEKFYVAECLFQKAWWEDHDAPSPPHKQSEKMPWNRLSEAILTWKKILHFLYVRFVSRLYNRLLMYKN